ncbi:vegetative cell wall protein gp1-like [Ailuropoda melanoleuca]|uniref:vegetative cell wall protein gp1-like n=1 Tax=Ailuropoda melanoleuca TaxID=9646 RepID=UPI0014949F47|nr:vegetative cell wall protein gp1-like [Ailuropoda melanoleuca]
MGKEREKDCDQVFEAESPFPQVLCVYPSQWEPVSGRGPPLAWGRGCRVRRGPRRRGRSGGGRPLPASAAALSRARSKGPRRPRLRSAPHAPPDPDGLTPPTPDPLQLPPRPRPSIREPRPAPALSPGPHYSPHDPRSSRGPRPWRADARPSSLAPPLRTLPRALALSPKSDLRPPDPRPRPPPLISDPASALTPSPRPPLAPNSDLRPLLPGPSPQTLPRTRTPTLVPPNAAVSPWTPILACGTALTPRSQPSPLDCGPCLLIPSVAIVLSSLSDPHCRLAPDPQPEKGLGQGREPRPG